MIFRGWWMRLCGILRSDFASGAASGIAGAGGCGLNGADESPIDQGFPI
jgi:hypothetical protein